MNDNFSGEDLIKEEDYIKENLENLQTLDFQLNEENKRRSRNQFKRDYTRVLYSSSFRRLQGKMQLLGVDSDQFYRNRLTHSLEVAQIARSIAEKFGYKSSELYVVETASLAHDLGNPPFGHYGEKVLNKLCQDGGFEGNAQTLRVLTKLEKKNPNTRGLNLSLRSLLAVIKYFNVKGEGVKKFIYNDDYDNFKGIILENNILIRTLDVQIIDLADEIAYAAHDLEDTLNQNIFTADELLHEFSIAGNDSEQFKKSYEKLENIIDKAKKIAYSSSIYNSSEEFSFIFSKELTSELVNVLIEDIGVITLSESESKKTGSMQKMEVGFKNYDQLASLLKSLTFKAINRKPHIQLYEKMGAKVIKGLYDVFMDENFNKDCMLMPVEYRPITENCTRERCVIDYISGMMDSYSIHTYEKFYGKLESESLYLPELFEKSRVYSNK